MELLIGETEMNDLYIWAGIAAAVVVLAWLLWPVKAKTVEANTEEPAAPAPVETVAALLPLMSLN